MNDEFGPSGREIFEMHLLQKTTTMQGLAWLDLVVRCGVKFKFADKAWHKDIIRTKQFIVFLGVELRTSIGIPRTNRVTILFRISDTDGQGDFKEYATRLHCI